MRRIDHLKTEMDVPRALDCASNSVVLFRALCLSVKGAEGCEKIIYERWHFILACGWFTFVIFSISFSIKLTGWTVVDLLLCSRSAKTIG